MDSSRFSLLCAFVYIISRLVSGQSQWDVRYNANHLQLYYNNTQWYNILNEGDIDYRECGPLCDALSSSFSMVEYSSIDISSSDSEFIELSCQNNRALSQCNAKIINGESEILGLECMSSADMQAGAVHQLTDGRILYLYQPPQIDYLAWGHICYDDNDRWDVHAADLFCQALGYGSVVSGQYKVEYLGEVVVFGLRNFNCDGKTSLSGCTLAAMSGDGRCSNDKVIKIECQNPITEMATTSTGTITTTPGSGSQNITVSPASNNVGSSMAIVAIVLVLLILSLVFIGGLITLIILVMKHKRKVIKSKVLMNQHNLSELVTKSKGYEQYESAEAQTADYLVPKCDFDENYTHIDDIYETALLGYDQYVPTSEDRNYYSIEENQEALRALASDSLYQTSLMCESQYWEPGTTIEGIYAQMSHNHFREINQSELVQDKVLGEGNFGLVVSGNWKGRGSDVPVAMKSLKNESEGSDVNFLQEAAILGQFNHPNVLKLLGMVTLTKPLTMVTELMRIGLKEFLTSVRKSGDIKFDVFGPQFFRFTDDIAKGMEHLSSKKFIHRDLSARNVLVSNNLVCKIADFGLARHAVEDDDYYISSGGLIPLKWTSPEALFYKKYSEKSDVWSYGITLYEIWSVGRVPWQGLKPDEIIQRVSDGIVMCPPSGCPKKVYELMVDCWNPCKDMRSNFNEIVASLADNDDVFLERGNNNLERMQMGETPAVTKELFMDLQTKYVRV